MFFFSCLFVFPVSLTTCFICYIEQPEPPKWLIEPSDTDVVDGTAAVIDCMVQGVPTPQITWKRLVQFKSSPATSSETSYSSSQYQLIKSGSANHNIYENGSLAITKVSTNDGGEYLCSATNGIGSGISRVIQLTVNRE